MVTKASFCISTSMAQNHIQLAMYYITHIIGAYSKNIYVFDNSSCTSV